MSSETSNATDIIELSVLEVRWIQAAKSKSSSLQKLSAKARAKTVFGHLKDVRANCFCASLLRTQIHATSWMSARAMKIN